MVVFCLLLEVQINQEAAQVSGSPQANTGIVCSGSKCLSLPECFLVVSTMKTFICVLSVWFSTLANCSAPTKQGIEEKCCSRKCRLLMPFTFHYRANATTSRLQRFLNCAALAAVWRKVLCTLILKMVVRHQKLARDTKTEFSKYLTQIKSGGSQGT